MSKSIADAYDKFVEITNVVIEELYIKDEYKPLITNLRIPAVINGNAVYHIPAGFNVGASKLNNVIFPKIAISNVSTNTEIE